ncbi:MAG: SLC13 family permease [Myxococcota bacterium]|nr:SLC13 family permease [Myxococcota bacterium]
MDHQVPLGVTLLFAALLVVMIACLALEEKIHAKKSVIVGVFAVGLLLIGGLFDLLPFSAMDLHVGETDIHLPIYIPAIDWGVVAIILGSSLFVDITAKSGLFTWIAIKLTKASRGDPLVLLAYYGAMTVVFSAVLNNVTAMIIVGSLSAVSLRRLGIQEQLLGFLLIEGLLTNVGGMLTLISSVPNIIVGNTAGISFFTFFVRSAPYVVVSTAASVWLGARLFGIRRLATQAERAAAKRLLAGLDENDGLDSKLRFWLGAILLLAFIVVIASASIPGTLLNELGMGYVAISFAIVALIQYKATADRFYRDLDWDLLAFFAALFIVINVMEHAQVLHWIGRGLAPILELGERAGPAALLLASALASSVTDNIPLAAMLAKILGGLDLPASSPYWWAVIFGANLGGNLTPIGSASTLVAVTIIHKNDLELSFAGFVRTAFPYAVLQLALAVGYVLLLP